MFALRGTHTGGKVDRNGEGNNCVISKGRRRVAMETRAAEQQVKRRSEGEKRGDKGMAKGRKGEPEIDIVFHL